MAMTSVTARECRQIEADDGNGDTNEISERACCVFNQSFAGRLRKVTRIGKSEESLKIF